MPSPEAVFEREAVRSYMVADLWVALGHDITDPRIAGQGVDLVKLWADLMDEVRSLRPHIEPDHECDFPPGITDSEQRYCACPVCGTHWVKVKRMVGRQMYGDHSAEQELEGEHSGRNAFRRARELRGWSIRDLAARAGIAPMTVQRIERGEPVRVASWRALASAFGAPEGEFVAAAVDRDVTRLTELLRVTHSVSRRRGA